MGQLRKTADWIFIAITGCVLIGAAAGIDYFNNHWHTSETSAQTAGSFLAFIASVASVLITLAFIYVTRRSLEAAQEANELQREQWEQRVNVKPKFWIPITQPDPMDTKPLRFLSNLRYPRISCVIWNYSEQSVLIHYVGIREFNVDDGKWRLKPFEDIIKPHSTISIDIESEILSYLCNSDAAIPDLLHLRRTPATLEFCIYYTDWKESWVRSPIIAYNFFGIDEESGPILLMNCIQLQKKQVNINSPDFNPDRIRKLAIES